MKPFIFLIILVFSIFGFSEFLHILKLHLIFPKRKMCSHLVINLQNENAEKQLLYALEQYNWLGEAYADFLVLNCDNLNDEVYERCKKIAQKYGINYPERIWLSRKEEKWKPF